MKSRTWMRTTLVSLFALAMLVGMAAQDNPSQNHKPKHHQYKLIALGTLGGPNSYGSEAGGGSQIINGNGMVAGFADTSIPDPYAPDCFDQDCYLAHVFLWQKGVLKDLGSLPGLNSSAASGINERGWVTGYSENGTFDPIINFPTGRGVLWKNGKIIEIGTFGGYESNGIYVNNAGQVVGFATNTIPDPYSFLGAQTHTFLWQDGVMHDLGTLGGPDSFPGAGGVNQQEGLIAGGSFTNWTPNPVTGVPTFDPFLWKDGHMRDLGTLGGTLCCQNLVAVNNRGQVAGDSNLPGDLTHHPFLWDKGTLYDLGTLGGDNGVVNWIDDAGDIVGKADLPGSQTHDAFLWRNRKMTDLEAAHRQRVELFVPAKPARRPQNRGRELEYKPGDSAAVKAWKRRMASEVGKQIYKERAATSETVNADLRSYRGLTQITVRGLAKIKCVVLWCALAYNVMHFGTALLS